MSDNNNTLCSSCLEYSRILSATRSKLSIRMLFLCQRCKVEKFEPRPTIVFAARAKNIAAHDYIINRRYVGAEITAKEILVLE